MVHVDHLGGEDSWINGSKSPEKFPFESTTKKNEAYD